MNNNNVWQQIRYFVLLLFVVLITISYHPTIVSISRTAGIESGTILSRYVLLIFIVLFVMNLKLKSMFKSKAIRVCWIMYLLVILFYFITVALFGNNSMYSDVRSMAICLMAIMIGWQMTLDEKRYNILLLLFAALTLFVGLMQVNTNIGSFIIEDQYLVDAKNSLGAILSTATIIFFFLGMNEDAMKGKRVVCLGLSIIAVVVLLTIRARTATLTSLALLLFVLYEHLKGRKFVLSLTISLFLFFFTLLVLPSSVIQFVHNSFFQNYEGGDITAGRADTYFSAIDFLSNHILFGNLNQNVKIGWIHNYPLNRFFEFGVVFVFPVMLIYFYLLINIVRGAIMSNCRNHYSIGYFLLLVPFIISMAEPTFPFGPNTVTVFNFIVFGMTLRNSYNDGYITTV